MCVHNIIKTFTSVIFDDDDNNKKNLCQLASHSDSFHTRITVNSVAQRDMFCCDDMTVTCRIIVVAVVGGILVKGKIYMLIGIII